MTFYFGVKGIKAGSVLTPNKLHPKPTDFLGQAVSELSSAAFQRWEWGRRGALTSGPNVEATEPEQNTQVVHRARFGLPHIRAGRNDSRYPSGGQLV